MVWDIGLSLLQIHQGKSRWHSYHVLVYISPVFTYLFGDCAMYFDHGGIETTSIITIITCFAPDNIYLQSNWLLLEGGTTESIHSHFCAFKPIDIIGSSNWNISLSRGYNNKCLKLPPGLYTFENNRHQIHSPLTIPLKKYLVERLTCLNISTYQPFWNNWILPFKTWHPSLLNLKLSKNKQTLVAFRIPSQLCFLEQLVHSAIL